MHNLEPIEFGKFGNVTTAIYKLELNLNKLSTKSPEQAFSQTIPMAYTSNIQVITVNEMLIKIDFKPLFR